MALHGNGSSNDSHTLQKRKACDTHCYKPAYRAKIKEVMRYSGIHFIKRGRLDWLVRYFLV
ncbi:MAG: nitrous oxide-stimulated promoter family protein [Planctomycetota bacterium]